MWNNNGQACVGLAYHNLVSEGDVTLVKIKYKLKKGSTKGAELYPDKLRMKTTKILNYPTKMLKLGVEVYIVPIEDFERVKVLA